MLKMILFEVIQLFTLFEKSNDKIKKCLDKKTIRGKINEYQSD